MSIFVTKNAGQMNLAKESLAVTSEYIPKGFISKFIYYSVNYKPSKYVIYGRGFLNGGLVVGAVGLITWAATSNNNEDDSKSVPLIPVNPHLY